MSRHSAAPAAPNDPDSAVAVVLSSPAATRELLLELAGRIDLDLMADREHSGTIAALGTAHAAFVRAMVRAANRPGATS